MKDEPKKSLLDKWKRDAIMISYAKFQAPASPGANLEPVYEFSLNPPNKKYQVDWMLATEHVLIWEAHGEQDYMPLANVVQLRVRNLEKKTEVVQSNNIQ